MAVKFDFKTLGQPTVVDWPVTVFEPKDGGVVEKSTFMARFKVLTDTEQAELQEAAAKPGGDPYTWINAFFVGLGKGEEPLDDETRTLMLGLAWMRTPLVRAYLDCQAGSPAKN